MQRRGVGGGGGGDGVGRERDILLLHLAGKSEDLNQLENFGNRHGEM